ncbi:MAG: formate/nitrite transporter family protein [Bacilli bacterium]|nr:formate/nitrite transporter family protein [Bacilli bacterium]
MLKRIINTLVSSFISGILIAIGGVVFLSTESKYLGAFAFAVGLFFIVEGGFKLYTGAIGYALDNDKITNFMLPIIIIGNFLGTFFVSGIIHLTRIFESINLKAVDLVNTKLNDSWYSVLILAIMCGVLIYLGVNTFKKSNNNFSKVFGIIICVFVFIISSYEHCIANMFYISIADLWSIKSFLYMLIMILGNTIGGLLIPGLSKIIKITE